VKFNKINAPFKINVSLGQLLGSYSSKTWNCGFTFVDLGAGSGKDSGKDLVSWPGKITGTGIKTLNILFNDDPDKYVGTRLPIYIEI
jgi:hypothetical protein